MKDFFATIYEFFSSIYGEALATHLYGWNGIDYNDGALYSSVGIYMLIFSFVIPIIFYYIINSPSISRWYHWLLFLLINFAICWGFGFYLPYIDYTTGMIAEDVIESISKNDIVMFGFVNAIWSAIFFTIISFILRGLALIIPGIGHNTRYTPIPR